MNRRKAILNLLATPFLAKAAIETAAVVQPKLFPPEPLLKDPVILHNTMCVGKYITDFGTLLIYETSENTHFIE